VAKRRVKAWRNLALLVAVAFFAAVVYRWISLERLIRLAPEITATPTPEPSPTRPPLITGKIDIGKLFNGITLHSSIETKPGMDATTERTDPDSYIIDLKLSARVPSPNKTMDELTKVSPQLPTLLPGLASMLPPEPVSPLYSELYQTKLRILQDKIARLDLLLSRHNFFDCQTVLQLQHPQSHRKAVLLQADMDVDADGSDGDRMPAGTGAPTNFKPFTSYKWPKKTEAPNPYLGATEDRLKQAENEFSSSGTTAERKRELRSTIAQIRTEVFTLKKFSFLIGATDPYIVIPALFAHGPGATKVGDYALVIFGDSIYPAIVGDIGPNDRVGEASLRIAKEINPMATPYNRPVSDLKVTYLLFPGSADTPWGSPDYDKLQARCQKLLDEIGGATVPLHHWENIIPPPPTPTPTPTPSPASPSSPPVSPSAPPAATFAFPTATPTPP
jgi:hypothetical protein